MLFVALGNVRAGTLQERTARRLEWQYPEGAHVVAEYRLQTQDGRGPEDRSTVHATWLRRWTLDERGELRRQQARRGRLTRMRSSVRERRHRRLASLGMMKGTSRL